MPPGALVVSVILCTYICHGFTGLPPAKYSVLISMHVCGVVFSGGCVSLMIREEELVSAFFLFDVEEL